MGCWSSKSHPAERAIELLRHQEEIPYDIIAHLHRGNIRAQIQSWCVYQNNLKRKVSIAYSRHYMAPILELQGVCSKGFIKEVYQLWPAYQKSH